MSRESAETALCLKKIYSKIFSAYFPMAEFVKPLGDGLLMIIPQRSYDLNARLRLVGACGLD